MYAEPSLGASQKISRGVTNVEKGSFERGMNPQMMCVKISYMDNIQSKIKNENIVQNFNMTYIQYTCIPSPVWGRLRKKVGGLEIWKRVLFKGE